MMLNPLARGMRLLRRLRGARLARDRRGNVMMIFAFAVIPITFATGMGIDYGAAMRLQTRLNAVSDAAALAAVSKSMMSNSMLTACSTARGTFTSQITAMNGLVLDVADPTNLTITVTDTLPTGSPVTITCPATGTIAVPAALPLQRSATVTYRGQSQNSFSGVLGVSTLTVKGVSNTKTTLAPYIDIHLALDTSQSMGLAASDADAAKLWNGTILANGRGCQFGCHVAATGSGDKYANDLVAQYFGATLRVDVLRQAALDMITTARTNEGTDSLYRFGMYRIGRTTTDISALTANLSQSTSDVTSLTMGPNDSSGYGDTNLPDMLTYVLPKIVARGDGSTQAKARAFLFIVTDGVTDLYGGCRDGHCTRPLSAAGCQAYKNAGVTVGVVYTTYLPVRSNPLSATDMSLRPEYTDLIKAFSDYGYSSPNPSDNSADISPALQGCASPGWFFEASDGATIHAAMQKLFTQATQSAVITR